MRYLLLLVGCLAMLGCENPVGPSEPDGTSARRRDSQAINGIPPNCAPIVVYPEHEWFGACRTPDGYVYDKDGKVIWWSTGDD